MLTKSNYHEWSLLMMVKLQARRLWEAVHVGGVDYDNDRRALEAFAPPSPPSSAPPSPTRLRQS